jgi:hypothetical protein
MNKGSKSAEASPSQLSSTPELSKIWDHFRAGGIVLCAQDKAPLAVAVDAAAGSYRFVCTQCGSSSPWFDSGPAGLRVQPGTLPFLTGSSLADE